MAGSDELEKVPRVGLKEGEFATGILETGEAVLVETGKKIDKNQTAEKETGKEAAAVDGNQTGISARFQKFLDEVEFVDLNFSESGCGEEVDEEDRKYAAELEEHLDWMWEDCLKILHRHGVEFADPSDPHCLVAC